MIFMLIIGTLVVKVVLSKMFLLNSVLGLFRSSSSNSSSVGGGGRCASTTIKQ